MSFLTPWAFWIAAIVVPALLILYFLKLRRREEPISSTFLWKRAVQDLQVNAPFQRLRKNLLLLLQLIVLALGVFALARPIVESAEVDEDSIVLLLDRSASMNTIETEDGRTRLDLAKEQATRLVRTLNQTGSRWYSFFSGAEAKTRVMVIGYADRASVVAPFTTHTSELVDLIERIEPTDGATNLPEALELAEAYMQQTRIEQTTEPTESASRLVLISDGCVPSLKDVVLRAASIKFIKIGEQADNVGITALRIQRNYERPEMLGVFCQVQNFSATPVETDVSIYVNGRLHTVWEVALGVERSSDTQGGPETGTEDRAGSISISDEIELPSAAVLEARIARRDGFMVDNAARVVVPPPRKLSVLLVSEKNPFLENVLKFMNFERFDYLTPVQYESAADARIESEGRSVYDVVIFDKHDTARLPLGAYLFINSVPLIEGVEVVGEVKNHALLWWDETHPVLRHVALDYVYIAKGLKLSLPDDAQFLMEGPQGPALVRYVSEGRHYLILGFPVEYTTWCLKPGFPIFIYNTMLFLGQAGALGEQQSLHPGDTLRIAFPPGTEKGRLLLPSGQVQDLSVDDSGLARFAGTHRVGLYRAQNGVEDRDRFAVNLENPLESDIAPRLELGFNETVTVELGETIETATPEIWRWFVGVALAIALLEWAIYNRRVML